MPKYAIVTVVDAAEPDEAWEKVGERLLQNESRSTTAIAYVGAPWLVPEYGEAQSAEYETEGICLRLDGESVDLSPAD
jgi:hypothetical protein